MWLNTLVTVLLCQHELGLRILKDSVIHQKNEGSGCQQTENEHFFDYISVDDEDYYEDGSAVGFIKDHQEFVDNGTHLFMDSQEEGDNDDDNDDEGDNEIRNVIMSQQNEENIPLSESSIFPPESLVLNNKTHGSLNGKFLITNSEKGAILDLYFENQENSTIEDDNQKKIILRSNAISTEMFILSQLCRCLYLFMLYLIFR